MSHKNLVMQSSTSSGSGDFTVTSATGWRTLADAHGIGPSHAFSYAIRHRSASPVEYEIGTGYMSDATTLVRASVSDSSNGNAVVDFSAGAKDVIHAVNAETVEQILADIVALQADVATLATQVAAAQPGDATLTALAGALTAAGKIPYATATDTLGELTLDTDGTLAGNSDTKLASQKAVKTFVDLHALCLAPFEQPGVLAVAVGKGRYRFPIAVTLISVAATVNTAPTGASVLVDVNKNGTTIFTTQSNRPSIAASAFASSDATPDVTAMAAGDYLTVDIDQIGSTIPGADLEVLIRYKVA